MTGNYFKAEKLNVINLSATFAMANTILRLSCFHQQQNSQLIGSMSSITLTLNQQQER